MTIDGLLRLATLALAIILAACSPSLNWRQIRMEQLTAMLPCKPDQAKRMVRLGTQDVTLQMQGCEASQALYAISHVRVGNAGQVNAVQADWRSATLATMQATTVQARPFQLAKASASMPAAPPGARPTAGGPGLELLQAQGRRADGSAVQARLVWFARGVDIYHVAVYGPQLDNERVEMLFSELRLQ